MWRRMPSNQERRHPGESRDLSCRQRGAAEWIPAFARDGNWGTHTLVAASRKCPIPYVYFSYHATLPSPSPEPECPPMQNAAALAQFDTSPNNLEAFWMPFTANRQFKDKPRLLVGAKDMHYTSIDGRRILDGTAGLWCVNAGHGRQQIVDAVRDQTARMDYAP